MAGGSTAQLLCRTHLLGCEDRHMHGLAKGNTGHGANQCYCLSSVTLLRPWESIRDSLFHVSVYSSEKKPLPVPKNFRILHLTPLLPCLTPFRGFLVLKPLLDLANPCLPHWLYLPPLQNSPLSSSNMELPCPVCNSAISHLCILGPWFAFRITDSTI